MKKYSPSFMMALVLLIPMLIFGIGCPKKGLSQQDVVNTISDVMDTMNSAFDGLEDIALLLHDQNILVGENWETVRGFRNKAAPIMIQLNENWKLVPDTAASVEGFILTQDFQEAVKLIAQIAAIVKLNSPRAAEIEAEVLQLKRAA